MARMVADGAGARTPISRIAPQGPSRSARTSAAGGAGAAVEARQHSLLPRADRGRRRRFRRAARLLLEGADLGDDRLDGVGPAEALVDVAHPALAVDDEGGGDDAAERHGTGDLRGERIPEDGQVDPMLPGEREGGLRLVVDRDGEDRDAVGVGASGPKGQRPDAGLAPGGPELDDVDPSAEAHALPGVGGTAE